MAMMIVQAALILRAEPPTIGIFETQRTADVSAYDHLPRGERVQVLASGPVTLGRAAFPIWRVTRDGREIPSRGPLITFEAQPGVHRVERRVLWQERWGALTSGAAVPVLLVLLGLNVIPRARASDPAA